MLHKSWFLKRVGLLPRTEPPDPPVAGSTASVPGELHGITSASPSLSATDDATLAESNCQQAARHEIVDLIGIVAEEALLPDDVECLDSLYSRRILEDLRSNNKRLNQVLSGSI